MAARIVWHRQGLTPFRRSDRLKSRGFGRAGRRFSRKRARGPGVRRPETTRAFLAELPNDLSGGVRANRCDRCVSREPAPAGRPGSNSTIKKPGRQAEGPGRPGCSCPPPQVEGKSRSTQRVRRRAGIRIARWRPPLRFVRNRPFENVAHVPDSGPAPGRPA